MLPRLRRTKIIATLGPSTDYKNNLEKIISAGVNVVRLNFSHGTPEDHILRAKKVRDISYDLNCYVAILGDLQGPKIRILKFKKGKIFLTLGDIFCLDSELSDNEGTSEGVGIDYKNLPNDVIPNDILLLDDGRIQLKVLKIQENIKIFTKVIVGGFLSNNKGINKLGGGLSAKALTEKDKNDIIIASKIDVDYLAISFPRNNYDVEYAKRLIHKSGSHAKIVAKIERAEAVYNIDSMNNIILSSDVIMVARGDLGVEIGDAELARVQKILIKQARYLNKAVITATQMMESMILNPIPTRAEVMDVANAVIDGTDAVMLSAETATGSYPVETVKTMASICLGAERIPSVSISKHKLGMKFNSIEETIAMSSMYAANHLKDAHAIVLVTDIEQNALMMSRINSSLPIFIISCFNKILNLTALYRGVMPICSKLEENNILSEKTAIKLLRDKGFVKSGDLIIFVKNGSKDKKNTIINTHSILRV